MDDNQPWSIKRLTVTPDACDDEWSTRSIAAQMQIEASYIEPIEMIFLVDDAVEPDSGK